MRSSKLKRACSALLAVTAAVTIMPLLNPPVASAAGVLQGALNVRTPGGGAALNSGNGDTVFTLRPPTGAACGGDSANDFYTVQSYMVPASVDPSTLTFNSAGPIPAGSGANFRQPMYNSATSGAYTNALTLDNPGSPRPKPGEIINIPDFTVDVHGPGDIPPGAYNIGLACTFGPAGATQMKEFWNTTMTFTTNPSGGFSQVSWSVGAAPAAPTLTTVTPGDATLTAAFSHSASTPASNYTATATPQAADPDCTGGAVTSPSQATTANIVLGGLVNSCTYDVVVTANNGVGSPAVSNTIAGTPIAAPRPPVATVNATPGTGSALVSWTAPASGPAPTGYSLVVTNSNSAPNGASPYTLGAGVLSQNVTGLTAGTLYTFTVTPTHATAPAALPASATATPFSSQILQQNLQVTRPVGALVLTQVCSSNGAIPAETGAQLGFPDGSLTAIPADASGTAPTTTAGGAVQDGNFPEYPYPVDENTQVPNATYPTHCGINLGIAKFVTSGPGAGQFFRASGVMNQIHVVETRDDDSGWTINGAMTAFTSGANSFSGSQLGWTPQATDDSDPVTFSDGSTYDQLAVAGPGVAPNTANAAGLSSGRELGHAAIGRGLGIAVLDARLKLLIPVTANSGVYTATLSITSV